MRTTPGRLQVLVLGVVGIVVIGLVDYATGFEIRIFPLYYLPIAYGAWRGSRSTALLFSLLSAGAWFASNWEAGRVYSVFWIWPINVLTQFVAFASIALLISTLRTKLASERNLSRRDPLTSLMNRRAFSEQVTLLLAVCRRTKQCLTMVQLDLDNFKSVNDQQGHLEGDRVLVAIANILAKHIRASDVVCRLGGDEFAMALHGAGPNEAQALLARLQTTVATAMAQHQWPVTISAGGSSFANDYPETPEVALHAADLVLYRAKRDGRNRVYVEPAASDANQ